MNQFIVETHIEKGHLESNNIPFPDDIDVKVIVVDEKEFDKYKPDSFSNLVSNFRKYKD